MEQSQTTRRQNIEQERGREAWKAITEIKEVAKAPDKKELEKKYRSIARGLNAMIQINGLGQTLGFLRAKAGKEKPQNASKKTEHYYLLEHLTRWMREPGHFKASNSAVINDGYDGLLRWVVDEKTTSADYRRATTGCLAFGLWLRRFAEAELEGEGEGA